MCDRAGQCQTHEPPHITHVIDPQSTYNFNSAQSTPQPFARESKGWLASQIEGRFVYCQLLKRDQYDRIVAVVRLRPLYLPGWLVRGRCLSMEMLHAGWCVVYEQGGAQYGPEGLVVYKRLEEEAR